MDASPLHPTSSTYTRGQLNSKVPGRLLIALGVISLLGSLAAAGALFPHLGYASLGIGGAGIALSIACFITKVKWCTLKTPPHNPTPTHKTEHAKWEEEEIQFTREEELPPYSIPPASSNSSNTTAPFTAQPWSQNGQETPMPQSFLTDGVLTWGGTSAQGADPAPYTFDYPGDGWGTGLSSLQPSSQGTPLFSPHTSTVSLPYESEEEETPPIETEDLPPLTPLAGLEIPPSLQKDITKTVVEKVDQKNVQLKLEVQTANSPQNGAHYCSTAHPILSIPLYFFLDQSPKNGQWISMAEEMYKENLEKEERKEQVALIRQRLEEFDQAIQLKERFKRAGKPESLKVHDLLYGWDNSPLFFALMSDEELSELKVSEVEERRGWEHLYKKGVLDRIISLPASEFQLPDPFDPNSIPLSAIGQLDVATLNKNILQLPPVTLLLIEEEKLPGIKMGTVEQINFLFRFKERVQLLTPEQAMTFLPSIQDKKCLSHLTLEQVQGLDLENLDEETIGVLFNKDGWSVSDLTKELIPTLELEQVYSLATHFEWSHWKLLSDDQIKQFDFTQIPEEKRKEVFLILYKTEKEYGETQSHACRLFETLTLEQIYTLSPYFSTVSYGTNHWKHIPEKYIPELNFEKIPENIRESVFYHYYDTHIGYNQKRSPAETRFEQLSLEQIYTLSPYFSTVSYGANHWRCIPEKYIPELNFEKIPENIRESVFYHYYDTHIGYNQKHSPAETRFEQLSLEQIYTLSPYFSTVSYGTNHWRCIPEKHILAFDFNQVPEEHREYIFQNIFFTTFSSHAEERLPKLSAEQVAVVEPYLDETAKKFLPAT